MKRWNKTGQTQSDAVALGWREDQEGRKIRKEGGKRGKEKGGNRGILERLSGVQKLGLPGGREALSDDCLSFGGREFFSKGRDCNYSDGGRPPSPRLWRRTLLVLVLFPLTFVSETIGVHRPEGSAAEASGRRGEAPSPLPLVMGRRGRWEEDGERKRRERKKERKEER